MDKDETETGTERPSRGGPKGYPTKRFETSTLVSKAIEDCGGEATQGELEAALNTKGGNLAMMIASAKKWGLIEGRGKLTNTELAKKILHPTTEDEAVDAKREAFTAVPMFKELEEQFRGNFPKDDLFQNLLIRRYNVNEKDAITLVNIIKESASLNPGPSDDTKATTMVSALSKNKSPELGNRLISSNSRISESAYEAIRLLGVLETSTPDNAQDLFSKLKSATMGLKSTNDLVSLSLEELSKGGKLTKELLKIKVRYIDRRLRSDLGLPEESKPEAGLGSEENEGT